MIPKYYKENYVIAKDGTMELIIVALILIFFVGAWVVIVLYAKDKTPTNPSTKNLSQSQVQDMGYGNIYGSNNGKEYGTLAVYDSCPVGQCPTNINTGEKRCSANPSLQMIYDPTTEECNPRNSCTGVTTPYGVLFDGSTSLDGSCDPNAQCRCINTLYTPSYIQSIFNVTNGSILQSNPQNINKWYFTQSATTSTGQGNNNVPVSYTDPSSQFYEISGDLLIAIQSTKCSELYASKEIGDSLDINDTLQCINSNPCIQGAMAYVLPYNNAGQDTFSTTSSYANFDISNNFNSVPLACVPNSIENSATNPISGTWNVFYKFQAPVFNFTSGRIHCVNPIPVTFPTNISIPLPPTPPPTPPKPPTNVETVVTSYTSPTASQYLLPVNSIKNNKILIYSANSGDSISFSTIVVPNDVTYSTLPPDFVNLVCYANFVEISTNGAITVIKPNISHTNVVISGDIYWSFDFDDYNIFKGGSVLTINENGIYGFEIINYSSVLGTGFPGTSQSSNTYLTDLASLVITKAN
jgi:hypothetical protein